MKRKPANPLVPTRRPLLPPQGRSRAAHVLTAAAAEGRFALPCCDSCGAFTWPARDACPACLGRLQMQDAPDGATILATTQAEVPADAYFRERAPWRTGLVQMEAGPQAIVHLGMGLAPGDAARLTLMLDRAGQAVLYARTPEGDMAEDAQWQEMVADPRGRRILITDARHIAALPLARALTQAGAAAVWLGVPEPWKPFPGSEAFAQMPGVSLVPLDIVSDRSVSDLAGQIAGKVEIMINTADLPRPGGLSAPTAPVDARAMMEVVAFGQMRLARHFGPAMAARGADGPKGAIAWVNLLSVFARAHPPALAGYGAAHAAALALSHGVRADLAQGGVRLMNVFAGPSDDPWFQSFGPPRVTGKALADGIVKGLMRGLEEVVVGDVARDLMARLQDNPTAVARELAQGGL